jgi:hypothetical protein
MVRRLAPALLVALAARVHADGGDAIVTRARTAARAQLVALAGQALELSLAGEFRDSRPHAVEAVRRVAWDAAGQVTVGWVSGRVDGAAIDETAWRKRLGGRGPNPMVTLAQLLGPLDVPGVDVTADGAAPDGGAWLRCTPRRGVPFAAMRVLVDAASGARREAVTLPITGLAGHFVHAEMRVFFDADGRPREMRSHFDVKFGLYRRSADIAGARR